MTTCRILTILSAALYPSLTGLLCQAKLSLIMTEIKQNIIICAVTIVVTIIFDHVITTIDVFVHIYTVIIYILYCTCIVMTC